MSSRNGAILWRHSASRDSGSGPGIELILSFRIQKLDHRSPGPAELAFRGSWRDVQESGDLLVGISLDVVQYENGPGTGRQAGHRALELQSIGRVRRGRPLHGVRRDLDERHPPIGPLRFTKHIDQDSAQPGDQRRAPFESGHPGQSLYPGLLDQVVGVKGGSRGQIGREPVKTGRMAFMQVTKGAFVTLVENPAYQLPVRQRGQGLHPLLPAGVMKSCTGIMMFASGVPGFTTTAARRSGPPAIPIDSLVR